MQVEQIFRITDKGGNYIHMTEIELLDFKLWLDEQTGGDNAKN